MIPDSFHVCKSIDYRVTWAKNGTSRTVDFHVNALNPNKVLGSHTELLCKRFDIDYIKTDAGPAITTRGYAAEWCRKGLDHPSQSGELVYVETGRANPGSATTDHSDKDAT